MFPNEGMLTDMDPATNPRLRDTTFNQYLSGGTFCESSYPLKMIEQWQPNLSAEPHLPLKPLGNHPYSNRVQTWYEQVLQRIRMQTSCMLIPVFVLFCSFVFVFGWLVVFFSCKIVMAGFKPQVWCPKMDGRCNQTSLLTFTSVPSLYGGCKVSHAFAKCLRITMRQRLAAGNGLLIAADRRSQWLSLTFHFWVKICTLSLSKQSGCGMTCLFLPTNLSTNRSWFCLSSSAYLCWQHRAYVAGVEEQSEAQGELGSA